MLGIILDATLSQDCREVRQLPTEERAKRSGVLLAYIGGILDKDGTGASEVSKSEVTYGLRIAAEYGGNNGNVLDQVTDLAQRYNSAIPDRGDHINQIILFENNKHLGYHRIPEGEEQ